MENNIEKHFAEFYNRLIFLDENLGEKENTFRFSSYHTNYVEDGKKIFSLVSEESEKDDKIFIRDKGLLLTLLYGDDYNKKYKRLKVFVSKDQYYKGEEVGSVKDLLILLDEFIENNYKEFNEKINKIIYGTDNTKNIKVKYRISNILNKDYIKMINISDAVIKDEDITKLGSYSNLQELFINDSKIDALNFSELKLRNLYFKNSDIKNIRAINNLKTNNLRFVNSRFLDKEIRPINIEACSLGFDGTEVDYKQLFFNTNFKGVYYFEIDGYSLSPSEVRLLKSLTMIRELSVDGVVDSYDFLYDLPELEVLRGYVESLDDIWFQRCREKYKSTIDFFELTDEKEIKMFLARKEIDDLLKIRQSEFAKSVRLSSIALTKWADKIRCVTDEDVRDIYKLSFSERKNIGREDKISFVETDYTNPFNLFFKRIEDSHLSKVVGIHGERLIKPERFGFTDYHYILGPDGEFLERIEKAKERDVVFSDGILEEKNIIVENKDNVFDYYYNRRISEKEKVTYLTGKVREYLVGKEIQEFSKIYNYNSELLEKIRLLEDEVDSLSYNALLFSYPRHKYKEVEIEFRGEPTKTYVKVPD